MINTIIFHIYELIISLNYKLAKDITVDYAKNIGSSTATEGGVDYSLTDGTATITAGNTTTNFSILITDDTNLENDETIVVDLFNPTAGIILGTNQYTYTIHDDDNARKIQFQFSSSSGTENINYDNTSHVF